MAQQSPFDALPPAVHLSVLLLLPRIVDRVRCALVSRRWAALLNESSLWTELSFEGVSGQLSLSTLLQLVRRSAGQLRSLDVTAEACGGFSNRSGGLDFLEWLAREGLTAQLLSLSSAPRKWVTVVSADDACRLLAACPALTHASVLVDCEWPDFLAIAGALPQLAGRTIAQLRSVAADDPFTDDDETEQASEARFVAFAAAVAEGLSSSHIDSIEFEPRTSDSVNHSFRRLFAAGSRPSVAQAASRLAAALADPHRGPRTISGGAPDEAEDAWGCLPAFSELCLTALTPESRLQHVTIGGEWADGRVAAELAAALAPGRSSIETIEIYQCDLMDDDGGAALMSALAHNTSLRSLTIAHFGGYCGLGQAAYPALRQALPRNQTLERLSLETFGDEHAAGDHGDGTDVAAQVFASLVAGDDPAAGARSVGDGDSTSGGAGGCSGLKSLSLQLVNVDAAAAAALGKSLRLGAPLEVLYVSCGDKETYTKVDGNALASEVGGALASLGAGSARLRTLRLQVCSVDDTGARALTLALHQPSCPLECLDLNTNSITDDGGCALALALAANTRLIELCLDHNRLDDGAACALGGLLTAQGAAGRSGNSSISASGLQVLGLFGNRRIGLKGAHGLAEGIRAAGDWLREVRVELPMDTYHRDGAAELRAAAESWLVGGGESQTAEASAGGGGKGQRGGARAQTRHPLKLVGVPW